MTQSPNEAKSIDEILRNHRGRVLTYHELFRKQYSNPHRLDEDLAHADAVAKQAITSLIKELVAEAKPGYRKPSYGNGVDENLALSYSDKEYNLALDQFEQNLLKALEEV